MFSRPCTSEIRITPPRHSSPSSFANMKQFNKYSKLCLFSLLLIGTESVAKVNADSDGSLTSYFSSPEGRACVCDYDADTDYFPVKLQQNYATGFSVEYENNYKVITVADAVNGDHVYYAHLCGTPAPEDIPEGAFSVEIPLRNVGLASTTFIPFLEYIRQRESITMVKAYDMYGSCMKKLIADEQVTSSYSIDESHLEDLNIDAIFSDVWSLTDVKTIVEETCSSTIPIYFPSDSETTPLGVAEWVEFAALFFNREEAANAVAASIEQRYNCGKDKATDTPIANNKVMYIGSLYQGNFAAPSCPNYYCSLIEDAGGDMFMFTAGNATEVASQSGIEEVDIILFVGVYDTLGEDAQADFDTVAAAAGQGVKIYDLSRQGTSIWFQNRPAEPDVLLQDLISIIEVDTEYSRVYFRDVDDVSEEKLTNEAADCVDTSAPLDTNWNETSCTDTVVTIPPLEQAIPACDTAADEIESFGCNTGTGDGSNSASVSQQSMVVVGLAALFAYIM